MMFALNKLFKYPVKKRKRGLFSVFLCMIIIYGGFQIVHFGDDYSPLQLLSSVESEATRLLRFMTQLQVHCNNSVATNNESQWMLCNEPTLGLVSDLTSTKGIVYSVGPNHDFTFEQTVEKNTSYRQFIFSHNPHHPEIMSNKTLFYKASIVPNDPADYGRNSFHTNTLNSIREQLHHYKIDVLKIENLMESVEAHELLHFHIEDSFLTRVKELHIVLQPDKVDEDYIYSWYRVLYSLFHKSGFRLYHTWASNSLCLQDIMESCKYFLSWIRDPPPKVFVLYPPAIDGSVGYEIDRLTDFLDESSSRVVNLVSIALKLTDPKRSPSKNSSHIFELITDMSEKVLAKNAPPCIILYILSSDYGGLKPSAASRKSQCSILCVIPVSDSGVNSFQFVNISKSSSSLSSKSSSLSIEDIKEVVRKSSTSILYIEDNSHLWEVITFILNSDLLKVVDEIILRASVFEPGQRQQPMVVRRKYSILKQVEAFGMALVGCETHKETTLRVGGQWDWMVLNFLKKSFL